MSQSQASSYLTSPFLFATCQPGAEAVLKQEVFREHPELKFAFSRPGFVTFRNSEKEMDPTFILRSIFARSYGLSFGKLGRAGDSESDLAQHASDFFKQSGALIFQIVERDLYPPNEEPKDFQEGLWVKAAGLALKKVNNACRINHKPNPGEKVATLLLVEKDEWWVGLHVHSAQHSVFPGSNPKVVMNPRAPSRAYIKMKEGLLWAKPPTQPDDIVVELGSAPGGSCFALLEDGFRVVGVDKAKMDPIILRHQNYYHLGRPISGLVRSDFPDEVHWLAIDMNVSTDVALPLVERFTDLFHDTLLGAFLTFKLNNWRYAESIPALLSRLEDAGYAKIRATQLSSNGKEFFVYGLTRTGVLRAQKASK